MAYCTECGHELPTEAKFCVKCGVSVGEKEVGTRRTSYDGVIHKCPMCGEPLPSFTAICASCGYEIRGGDVTGSIRAFYNTIAGCGSDIKKIELIKNFPIPNTKEDVFEFMLMACNNFDSEFYVEHLSVVDVSDAWLAKIEQCYKKAKFLFGDTDSNFARVRALYDEIKNKIEISKKKQEIKAFKGSRLKVVSIILLVISAIICAASFGAGDVLSGIVAIVMISGYLVTLLMGYGIIGARSSIRTLIFVVSCVLIIPCIALNGIDLKKTSIVYHGNVENLNWDELILGSMLPTPDKSKGRIVSNSEKELDLDIANATKSTFTSYIQSCKEKGFTIDILQEKDSFRAFNENGYRVKVNFSDFYDELSITLIDPIKRNSINWSSVPLMADVPKPPSSTGEFGNNFDWTVTIYLVNVTREQYDDYINKCIEEGFSIDMSRYENTFYGDNQDGLELQISWEGNNTIAIHVTNLDLM